MPRKEIQIKNIKNENHLFKHKLTCFLLSVLEVYKNVLIVFRSEGCDCTNNLQGSEGHLIESQIHKNLFYNNIGWQRWQLRSLMMGTHTLFLYYVKNNVYAKFGAYSSNGVQVS